MPPAPGRLSITILWPRIGAMLCAVARESVSLLAPGVYGTTSRIGFTGYAAVCANAAAQKAAAAAASAIRSARVLMNLPAEMRKGVNLPAIGAVCELLLDDAALVPEER